MANANEASSVRMHPWVTYVLGALLLGGSLALLFTAPDPGQRASESPEIQTAIRSFERNPEVDVSERFVPFIGREQMAKVRADHARRRDQGGVAVLSERMQEKTQKRFDEAQGKAFASLHDLPSFRFGIIDGSSPLENTFSHLVANESVFAIGVSMVFFVLAALCLEGAWGSILLGALCLLLPVVTRLTYTVFYGDSGVPWIGASGLVAGLLGAYLVRSFQGFTIPGWLVVPVWIIGEYLLARDLPIDHFDATPVVVHAVALSFGGLAALGIGVLGLEHKLLERQLDTEDLVANPVLEQALIERDHGNVEAAFDLLEQELKRNAANHDAAVALWQVASGTGLSARATAPMLAAIRDALRSGRREEACALWLMIAVETEPRAEGTLLVRVGEALLGEEEHEAALQAFAWAVDGPKTLSSVLAMRVVRGARDLDSDLAGRAAAVALVDDQLGASERAAMQKVVEAAELRADAAPAATPAAVAEAPTTRAAAPRPAPVATEPDPLQDPHAIAADAFQQLGEGESLSGEDPEGWNQPGVVEDLSAELEDEHSGFDWSGLADDDEAPAPPFADTNVDLAGAGEAPVVEAEAVVDESSDISETTDTTETTETTDVTDTTETTEPLDDTGGIDLGEGAFEAPRRALVVRAAAPVAIDEEGIFVEVEGGSKTRLPFARIEAVAAGAVRGLADKPVLIVDLVLNWLAVPDEPLKVVRLRSDGFDPRSIVSDRETPLDALRAMLDHIVAASGATPLPSRDAALGNPFASYPDLASYDADVLMAQSS